MCGIAGALLAAPRSGLEQSVRRMSNSLNHRGPDDGGVWVDDQHTLALGHRRLAIVELSAAGHQPMHSTGQRFVIVFNGEIYNHNKLRLELHKSNTSIEWRGHSDTETLLAAFEVWGIEATLQRCTGMFAIALWDRQTQTLTLARDRMGEKPLYYGWQGDAFLFGSELKALRAYPGFRADINRDALCLYMRYNNVPAPYSIYQGIQKLLPGTWVEVSRRKRDPQMRTYWSAIDACHAGKAEPFTGSATAAVDALETLLSGTIEQQMMADVPLGAFLSGGIDSSTVVALMQAQSSQPIRTFSIGFHEQQCDEAAFARSVARHLGTIHTDLYVTPAECLRVIPCLPALYDEPFSDSSQIPTFLVSQLARQHVTVSLSGDGGDELFAGYNRYQITSRTWAKLSLLPRPIRHWLANAITSISPNRWNRIADGLRPTLRAFGDWANIGDKLHKGAAVMTSKSVTDLYLGLVSAWLDPSKVVLGASELPTLLGGQASALGHLSIIEHMMMLDLLTYLPDDILCKVDRAAMGVSLETRVPLLDHRVVEFAWRLPLTYKLREGQTKWALRQVLYRHVPRELVERPKVGFAVPIDQWLRGALRQWADNQLDESRLRREGFFNPAPIQKKWAEHLSGKRNWQTPLWNVLMFQMWLEEERAH
ncbi:MAG: asparagine synthase (glutamine-hydrolyzing) [Betaproteobacteria bacterium]|nr:asparagine synthase (glutamine-hydrolyzing) [Betaproteobacteria bacterium]